MPKFPNVTVALSGEDGNVFAIMGRVTKAMRRAGISQVEINAYLKEVASGDYDHALQTTMAYVETT